MEAFNAQTATDLHAAGAAVIEHALEYGPLLHGALDLFVDDGRQAASACDAFEIGELVLVGLASSGGRDTCVQGGVHGPD